MNLARTLNLNEGQLVFGAGGNLDAYNRSEPYTRDWVYRHEGLQKAIFNHKIITEALSGDPNHRNSYITRKRTNLNNIAINLRELFKIEFKRQLDAGLTQEYAKKSAMKFVNEYKKKALSMHEKQFPDDFSYSKVMDLLRVKKNGVEHIDE